MSSFFYEVFFAIVTNSPIKKLSLSTGFFENINVLSLIDTGSLILIEEVRIGSDFF